MRQKPQAKSKGLKQMLEEGKQEKVKLIFHIFVESFLNIRIYSDYKSLYGHHLSLNWG